MRTNGTFEYKPVGSVQTDPKTGFAIPNDKAPFLKGWECQIDKSIPASSYRSADGQAFFYTYDVFIDKSFEGNITIGSEVEVTFEDGSTESFTVQGIDNANRKYLEIWG